MCGSPENSVLHKNSQMPFILPHKHTTNTNWTFNWRFQLSTSLIFEARTKEKTIQSFSFSHWRFLAGKSRYKFCHGEQQIQRHSQIFTQIFTQIAVFVSRCSTVIDVDRLCAIWKRANIFLSLQKVSLFISTLYCVLFDVMYAIEIGIFQMNIIFFRK